MEKRASKKWLVNNYGLGLNWTFFGLLCLGGPKCANFFAHNGWTTQAGTACAGTRETSRARGEFAPSQFVPWATKYFKASFKYYPFIKIYFVRFI